MPAPQMQQSRRESVLVYLGFAALMLGLQFAHDRVVGSDGFFHVAQAARLGEGMPWMPLSIFGDGWVDHHLLFHVLIAPLTWVLPGVLAAKVGAALLAAFGVWAIYFFLRSEGAPLAGLFALLPVAICWTLLIRLEMPRAQGLSLGLMVLGVMALVRDRPWVLFGICVVYTWAYQVAALMIPIAVLYLLVSWAPLGLERRRLAWHGPVAAIGGFLTGLVVHPHSPRTLRFFWQHVVLKVQNRAALPVGGEWEVGGFGSLLDLAGGGVAALVIALVLAVTTRRRELPVSRLTIFAILLAAASTVGTLRSAKFLEYSVPLSCIALAFAVRDRRLERSVRPLALAGPLLALVVAGIAWSGWRTTAAVVDTEPAPDRLASAMQWLAEEEPDGARVYHLSWNDFPELTYWGPDNEYIVGLDPHFLYLADPALWDLYDKIGKGWGTNPSKPIRDRFGASWVVLVLPWPGAADLLDADPGLRLAWSDDDARIYAVLPAM